MASIAKTRREQEREEERELCGVLSFPLYRSSFPQGGSSYLPGLGISPSLCLESWCNCMRKILRVSHLSISSVDISSLCCLSPVDIAEAVLGVVLGALPLVGLLLTSIAGSGSGL